MFGSGASKHSSGFWAFVTGTPLALWLGLGIARSGDAAPVSATPDMGSSAPVTPPVGTGASNTPPSDYCVARFLAPLETLAGVLPPKPEVQRLADKLPGALAKGSIDVEVSPAPNVSARSWLERVGNAGEQLVSSLEHEGKSVTLTPVIATVPDPIDSGLGYQFETTLQALRRGVEFSHDDPSVPAFYRDRSWLPWDDREVVEGERRASEECRRSMPGLMLFRGGDQKGSRVFVLLLVGESPTTGLRQTAMTSALSIHERLDRWREHSEPWNARQVRIVGPTYSGSAQSLHLALRNWAPEKEDGRIEFRVVSGTATGASVPAWLNGDLVTGSRTISFAATTVPEATVQCAYLRFLHSRLDVAPEPGSSKGQYQPLSGVATLSEVGTEFGATSSRGSGCPWAPASRFHFPFHVSALRDAYEDLDRRDTASRKDAAIARATSLPVSLRESRGPLDIEVNPSKKTRTAEDLALGSVLEYVSDRRVRHLAIHATDVGDAIFLARKIRDVAPDVRLAFFESDVLLLHPAFRRELMGSLVVSAYPFLGLSKFSSGPAVPRGFYGFDNGYAQGTFNALLGQRSVPIELLSDYSIGSKSPLPVWISTIGRNTLVPLKVGSTSNCAGTLLGAHPSGGIADADFKTLCTGSGDARRGAWKQFSEANAEQLGLEARGMLPYVWDLLFALLCITFLVDVTRQNAGLRRFDCVAFPPPATPGTDQGLDRAMGRTKWRFYRVVRCFMFLLAITYMGLLYVLNLMSRGGPLLRSIGDSPTGWLVDLGRFVLFSFVVLGAFLAAVYCTKVAAWRFWQDYREFGAWLGARLLPRSARDLRDAFHLSAPGQSGGLVEVPEAVRAVSGERESLPPPSAVMAERLTMGLTNPFSGRTDAAWISFAQLRLIATASTLIATAFAALILIDTLVVADFIDPRMPLTVLRNTQLTSGVSPATPALLCMTCVYVWAIGRMARLELAHSISRISPPDGESDLVSTPIRTILHPNYTRHRDSDAGFTEVERDLLNTIWRPITGRYYAAAAIALAFVPLVIFGLKPPSTLESTLGTLFLTGGLALSVFLIGITIVQLVQYWTALRKLLKRVMEHPLGSAFRSVPAFARDSVDHQVSRSPDEPLRWSACAVMFCDLVRSSTATGDFRLLVSHRADLEAHAGSLATLRAKALGGPPPRYERDSSDAAREPGSDDGPPTTLAGSRSRRALHPDIQQVKLEAKLAEGVIVTAAEVTRLLELAWGARAMLQKQDAPPMVARQETEWPVAAAAGSGRSSVNMSRASEASIPESGPSAVSIPLPRSERHTHDSDDVGDALTAGASRFSRSQLAWLRSAQCFVATVTTLLVHRHVRQFRYFLHVTTACALLLLLAIASYPFEPYRLLLTFIWIVMATVVGVGLWVFIQMDRNTWMSHVSGTSPDTVTLDGAFVLRLFAWAVVPLLSVAAAQYPDVSSFLFGFLEPFARALH